MPEFKKRLRYKVKDKSELVSISTKLIYLGYESARLDGYDTCKYIVSIHSSNYKKFGLSGITDAKVIDTLEEWFREVTGEEWNKKESEVLEYPVNSIEWWLARIDGEIGDSALKNRKELGNNKEKLCITVREAIGSAFTWNESPEGHDYWSKISGGATPIKLLDKPNFNRKSIINNSKTNKNGNKSNSKNGKIIVFNPSTAITGGKRYTGSTISCKTKRIGFTSGHLSHSTVSYS